MKTIVITISYKLSVAIRMPKCQKLSLGQTGKSVSDTNYFNVLVEKSGLTKKQIAKAAGVNTRTVYRWETGETQPKPLVFDFLLRASKERKPVSPETGFTFIDLFAGIGGMRKGFEAAGGECVFTSEWNEKARQTYTANHACDHPVNGDIREIDAKDIPDHDILVAGFPCQPFSIAGVSKKNALGQAHGFKCETQGTLFFDVARIIEEKQPAAFLLENVKNLKSHDKGNTFRVISDTLTKELGYRLHYRIIDAKPFVPQHRERIFMIGFRESNGFDFSRLKLPNESLWPKLGSILHPEDGSETAEPPYTEGDRAKVSAKYTLTDHLWNYLQRYAEKHQAAGNGFGFGLVKPEDTTRTLSARYFKDGSEILVHQKRKNPRRLTPRECARLMGFDKPDGSAFRIPVSDTQAYKQFGNAVVVPVVEAVAKLMVPFVLETKAAAGEPEALRA